ncbi:MAG: triacylglycerol lipase [Desmonostoc geniculatum HA4340-LM1]|jgi:triacylglycerol lipase|nr:triacylglycerol lipase [Desmonostoc geniculatum HA4340-LM1]
MSIQNQQRNPVLLIHGISDTEIVFQKMRVYLIQQGWSVHTVNLVPNNGDLGLDELAEQIADYVTTNFPPEQPLDLIGFSMGGIVSRYYVQRLGGIKQVQRFITISSPHNGTVLAYASLRPGCVQMRPNSVFLQDLNSDVDMLKQLNFTSIWTPYDLMIVPAKSSQMLVGKEMVLPVVLHSWMLTNSKTLAVVSQILANPIN